MAFDLEGARKAGYSDAEIAAHLAQSAGFDMAGAKKAGYSDGEMIAHLIDKPLRTGAAAVPTVQEVATGRYTPPAAAAATAEPGIVDKLIGAGEAALTVGTGATGGALGMVGGALGGLAGSVVAGDFGSPEAARRVEESAAQGMQALTYAPRTESGRDQVEVVGRVAQNLIPLAGLTGEMAALARAQAPAIRAVNDAGAAGLDKAKSAAQQAGQRIAEAPPPAAAAALPAEQLAQTARRAAEGGLWSKSATDILAKQAAPDQAKVAAARRLGISDYVQPDHVTTNEGYRQVVAAIKSNPQSQVALAEREGLARIAERSSNLIDEIGGTNDLSALSADVRTSLDATQQALAKSADSLYAKVRANVPAAAEAPASNVLGFVERRASDLGGRENLSALERQVLRKLAPRGGDDGMVRQPTYTLLDDVRKDVGAAARAAGPFKDADTGLAKKLYELLSEDQAATVERYGMRDVYDAARRAVAQRKAVEDDLAALFGRDLDRTFVVGGSSGLPGAVSRLAQGDSAQLGRLLASVPDEMRQRVVASGLSTVFRKAATRGEMDFTGYAKWYEGLRRNRQSYAAVMANLPLSARKQLEALYRVSSGVSESLNRRTKTGALTTIKAEMMGSDSLMESLFSAARRSGAGVAAEAVTTPLGTPGAGLSAGLASALTKGKPKALAAIDALIASQEFEQLARAAPGPERVAAVRRLAYSREFSRYVRAIGRPREMSDRELWLLRAMQQQSAMQQQGQQQRQQQPETLH